MFISTQQVTKEVVTFEELGGAMTHTKKSGELLFTSHYNTLPYSTILTGEQGFF